jgi:hypothetical protein
MLDVSNNKEIKLIAYGIVALTYSVLWYQHYKIVNKK